MKVLYFDTETTGLDAFKNDIIQIAGIVEIDGEVKEEFEFRCQPFSYENVDQKALDVHGMSLDEIRTYQKPEEMYQQLITVFGKYIDKFDKNDKFLSAGQNVEFDVKFLRQFFKKNGDNYYGSWIGWHKLDLLPLATVLWYKGIINPANFKLETIAKEFGLTFKAHDALEDIKVTRQLIKYITDTHIKTLSQKSLF